VRALLGGVLKWQVPARWYLFALAYIPAIKLTIALIHRLATARAPLRRRPLVFHPGAIAVSTPFQAGRRSAGAAMRCPAWRPLRAGARASCSAHLGLLAPALFIPEADTYGQSSSCSAAGDRSVRRDGGSTRAPTGACCWSCCCTPVNNAKTSSHRPCRASNPFALSASLVAWPRSRCCGSAPAIS